MNEKRSPLKHKPLRVPGQFLDEQIQLREDKMVKYVVFLSSSIALAFAEWWRWINSVPPQPVLYTVAAVIVVGYCLYRLRRTWKQIKALELGRDGERIVGEILDDLREKGYRIFHDITANGFNLDHVILSPHGIFVIETKTYSKPSGGKISIDKGKVRIAGKVAERDPITQVLALGDWLSDTLRESTGKVYPVKPVVVFPGWFVEPMSREIKKKVWVLNPKALPSFISNEPRVIRQEDMRMAAFHLSQYIRALR